MAASFWSVAPTVANDDQSINIGTKFVVNVAGTITHLRYYEQTGTTGTVTLRLVNNSQTVVASATHTAVTGQTGWREVALTTPYTVAPGEKYLTYYWCSSGGANNGYGSIPTLPLSTARSTPGGELTTIVDGVESFAGSTGNGVYTYGGSPATPVSTFNSGNYGADVVFEPLGGGTSQNTGALWGSGTPVTTQTAGSWSGVTNAVGPNDATRATWTSTGNGANGTIRVEGFAAQAAIGSQPDSVDSVAITVYGYVTNATRVPTIAVQLTSAGTLIGTPQSMTPSTSTTNSQTFTFTGVTWAQLANLGVRVSFTRAAVTTAGNGLVDAISANVTYTPAPTATTATPAGISSAATFGAPVVTIEGGPVVGVPLGVPSAAALGSPTATVSGGGSAGMHSIGFADPATKFGTVYNDGQPITTANAFRTSESGWVSTGAKYYFSAAWIAANAGNVTLLMQAGTGSTVDTSTGARLASAVATQPATPGWVEVTWASPVPMTADARYWIGAFGTSYTGYAPIVDMGFSGNQYELQAADGSNLWIGTTSGSTADESEYQYNTSAPGWITAPGTGNLFWGVDIVAGNPSAVSDITASPSGIASGNVFGAAAAVIGNDVIPSGIVSAEAFGTPTVAVQSMALSIVQENALTSGVAQRATWHDGADQTSMPAFARSTYYTPGQTAQFSVDYNAAFTAQVWRIGWYNGGTAARKVADLTGTPTNQPAAVTIPNSNGGITCAGWSVNLSWAIPSDATPGVYWLRLNGSGVSSQLVFVVSDKDAKKPVLMMLSDATWHGAYNYYGGKAAVTAGKSLYGSNGPMTGGIDNRSLCVSYDRPVVTREGIQQTYAMTDNIPMARFLERCGIEVGYTTCEQVDADPSILDGRTIVISSGHNEYISQRIYDKFKAISAAGTNLMNFGGNDFFWRTRYGTTTRSDTTTHGRVMWCYKDTMSGPDTHVAGTPYVSAEDWGGTWQDTRWALREDTGNLWGDRFIANGVRQDSLTVPFAYKAKPIWRNCAGIQALTTNQSYVFGAGSLGMEWDKQNIATIGPPRVALSATVVDLTNNASDINGENYNQSETATHNIIMGKTPGGGYVFNMACCFFTFTFDDFHDFASNAISNVNGRQAILNVLVDLGAAPDATMVSSASLTLPTPVADVESNYGIPAALNVTPTGIPSGATTGAVSVSTSLTVSATAIPSGQQVGVPTITATLTSTPAGIISLAATGQPSLTTTLTSVTGGIPSGQQVGSPSASTPLTSTVTGIPSALTLGTPVATSELSSSPQGVSSKAVVGTPSAASSLEAFPVGMGSAEAFGNTTVSAIPPTTDTVPVGIASLFAAGSPSVSTSLASGPSGIPSAAAVGAPTAFKGVTAQPQAITTGVAVGPPSATTSLSATPGGIPSVAAVGSPSVVATGADVTGIPTPIPSQGALGVPVALSVLVAAVEGVPSAAQVGSPSSQADLAVTPEGVSSAESFGMAHLSFDVTASPAPVASAEALGAVMAVMGLLGTPVARPKVLVSPYAGTVRAVRTGGTVKLED